jgi:RNAse (barnase) inhibitor barstar
MNLHEEIKKVRWNSVHFINNSDLDLELLSYRSEFDKKGYVFSEKNISCVSSEHKLFESVSEAFKFPDYFGNNWDALYDCLTDMSWLPAKGYVLLLYESKNLWANDPILAGCFLSLWLDGSEFWSKQKIPFHLVFVL